MTKPTIGQTVIYRSKSFSKDNLPKAGWAGFQKTAITQMVRIDGPFSVETVHEGVVTCEDGWLAVDAKGYPYPIAADEQAFIYVPVVSEGSGTA